MEVGQLYSEDHTVGVYTDVIETDKGAAEIESYNQTPTSLTFDNMSISPNKRIKREEQQRLLLQRIQEAMIKNESFYSSNDSDSVYSSSVRSLISAYAYDQHNNNSEETICTHDSEENNDIKAPPLLPLPKPIFAKFINFSTLKVALNRPKKLKNAKEPSITSPTFENNKQILFELKVTKWNSTNKMSFNNYLVLTQECLYHFKNIDKAVKAFNDYNDLVANTSSGNLSKLMLNQNIALVLNTVYAISEYLVPEPYIKIYFVSSPKRHDIITITSPDFQKHQRLLSTLRLAIQKSDPIGPRISRKQRSRIINELTLFGDWVDDDNENLLAHKVLLKSLKDNDKKQIEKKPLLTSFFVLGRNNVYLIPADILEEHDMNLDQNALHFPLLFEETKPKKIDLRKYQYPIMCLANIQSTEQDTFRLTFRSNSGNIRRTMDIASLFSETIITELRSAIDSITSWWPYSIYTLGPQTSIPAERVKPPNLEELINQGSGLERIIEAQCHAFRISKSRISFSFEHVLDTESIVFRQSFGNLLYAFTLHPPTKGSYSSAELYAVLSSLKHHPLIYKLILRNVNLSELQSQVGPINHEGSNMLSVVLYDILTLNPRLKILDLTSCGITGETMSAIGNAFSTGKSLLERLILNDNFISEGGLNELAAGLAVHGSLIKEFDVSNCRLTATDIESILTAFTASCPERLELFDLSDNTGSFKTEILSKFLSRTINLKTLKLRNCVKLFSYTIAVISVEVLGKMQLTKLDIGGISLNSHDHLNALYSYIRSPSFSKINEFSVDHCNLDGGALALLFSYLSTSSNHENLKVWAGGNYISRTTYGHKEFCSTISNNWTPVWLSLEDTVYGSTIDQIVEVLTSFCNNKVIKHLDLSYPQIKINKNVSFSLEDFMTAEKACAAIGQILKDNKYIKELILRGEPDKQWGPSLGVQLSGLEINETLERLNISGNSISGPDIKLLNEVLKINSRLKYLSIDENMASELANHGFQEYVEDLDKRLSISSETFGTRRHRTDDQLPPALASLGENGYNGYNRHAIYAETIDEAQNETVKETELEVGTFQKDNSNSYEAYYI
ncbi:27208_t:CDS:2 [Gigaspora margarita]|uniref:27208_t:CDS:1 n=1 Tax=Gigaspora margarita TaxID=4874 RepID=A0ABM8VYV1_GIGMA|nr:27208_t:CDS:2 [Gigaspora margarita]